ncbi:hypothetical protein M885DRAFT_578 [Pelagophyceae sp. CCMP2097]|nr:hypothetical protein M885DRAFT_578 [Pelagophyceae sp. CCMP2097]
MQILSQRRRKAHQLVQIFGFVSGASESVPRRGLRPGTQTAGPERKPTYEFVTAEATLPTAQTNPIRGAPKSSSSQGPSLRGSRRAAPFKGPRSNGPVQRGLRESAPLRGATPGSPYSASTEAPCANLCIASPYTVDSAAQSGPRKAPFSNAARNGHFAGGYWPSVSENRWPFWQCALSEAGRLFALFLGRCQQARCEGDGPPADSRKPPCSPKGLGDRRGVAVDKGGPFKTRRCKQPALCAPKTRAFQAPVQGSRLFKEPPPLPRPCSSSLPRFGGALAVCRLPLRRFFRLWTVCLETTLPFEKGPVTAFFASWKSLR